MVSIKGRSHTSANLDLEINEESKNNKDIVRYTTIFLISGRTEHSLVWQSSTQEDDSKSSKQDSEQPSKKKNVRDPPIVAKEKNSE